MASMLVEEGPFFWGLQFYTAGSMTCGRETILLQASVLHSWLAT